MFRFAPYVVKSLWRHRTRTLLTVSGAAVALFVFCFVGAVQEGLDRLTQNEDAQRTLIVFQENRFCPTSSRLPEDYTARIQKISGVKDVMPVQVWTNNCRASLDVIVFNGAPVEKLRSWSCAPRPRNTNGSRRRSSRSCGWACCTARCRANRRTR